MIAFWTVKDDKDDHKRGYFMIHDVLIPLTFVQESGKMIYRQLGILSHRTSKWKVWRWLAAMTSSQGYSEKSVFGTQQWSFVKLGFSILLMETFLHHLGCPKRFWYWYKTNLWGILSGAGFFSSTVLLMHKAPVTGTNSQVLTEFQSFSTKRPGYRWILPSNSVTLANFYSHQTDCWSRQKVH